MEKIRTITAHKYYLLSTYRSCILKGHKKYDQSMIISYDNKSGDISFEIKYLNDGTTYILGNDDSGIHEYPLIKGEKLFLRITSKNAKGFYKIQIKTIKQ